MGRDGRAMAENRPERLKAALRENLKRRKAQARSSDRAEPGGKVDV